MMLVISSSWCRHSILENLLKLREKKYFFFFTFSLEVNYIFKSVKYTFSALTVQNILKQS